MVRQQAMGSYLQKDKKLKGHGRSRKQSEDSSSSGSPTSATSDKTEAFDKIDHTLSKAQHQERTSRRTSSVPSPASHHSSRRTVTPECRVSSIPASLAMVLSSAPMVQPSRVNIIHPYLVASYGPLQSLGKPFDPFKSMYQPKSSRVSAEELKFHCTLSSFPADSNILICL